MFSLKMTSISGGDVAKSWTRDRDGESISSDSGRGPSEAELNSTTSDHGKGLVKRNSKFNNIIRSIVSMLVSNSCGENVFECKLISISNIRNFAIYCVRIINIIILSMISGMFSLYGRFV